MFKVTENENLINFKFSSEMYLIDRVIQLCRDFLKGLDISKSSEFRLVLRELLINAVEHGNQNDIGRNVICDIKHMGNRQFKVMVEDEGKGFDYRAIDMKFPLNPRQDRSRGYAMINAFTDRLEFNDAGNHIDAYISIPYITTFDIACENDWQIITPSGDITASTADSLRAILVNLIDSGHRLYRFDFKHVSDIDSVALSVMIIFAKMLGKKDSSFQLEIMNAGKGLRELFLMTRMDKIYQLK